jgi:phosphoribosylaminoimidazolecarboxamide formyltransferase / IMP cyclohydrolase
VRALLSVYDKSGIVELAEGLVELGWDLVSSGGTARVLADNDVPVTDVADLTGFPAIMGHRVVTLHPKVHGGILADRSDPDHLVDMQAYGIEPIDLVVGNLYPFASNPSIELIDIGGPAMVRAAAKNFEHIGVVVDPSEYDTLLEELRAEGALSDATRLRLALAAFRHTAAYDAQIVRWLEAGGPTDADDHDGEDEPSTAATDEAAAALPERLTVHLERAEVLRYGENPHQAGARYRRAGHSSWLDRVHQHGGLPLSYLNWFDADAAWGLVHDLGDEPAVAIIKHANPCGVAVAADLAAAYQLAYDCDPRSAFGGIVASNRPIDLATVERVEAAAQADVIIAPGYDDGVVDRVRAKRKNTRILQAHEPDRDELELRQIAGGFLVQEAHRFDARPEQWRVVTTRQPTEAERADAAFAWRVGGWVKSNSIVLAKDRVAWGIGAGQQNRVESGEIATAKAAGRAEGGACASDAFYPFPDGIEAAAAAGVAVIIQPGGAMRDDENIAKADELGVAMIFTGERHFRH